MTNPYGTDSNPTVEMLVDSTWTDISAYVRGEQRINIVRGRANEQARTSAQTAAFVLDNADGRFSLRNPTSPYYGLVNLNSQVRVFGGDGDHFARYTYRPDGADFGAVYTADKAALDITGDIDVRVDVWPRRWSNHSFMILASKWQNSGDQRSWALYLTTDGYLKFRWTTAGTTASQLDATSTVPVDLSIARQTVRVTLDVNNGAGGKTVTFYTGTGGIAGSFSTLGSAVTTAGTTSIFSSTARVTLGGGDTDAPQIFNDGMTFGGRAYGMQVRSVIGGTIVATADLTTQTYGATSWSDGIGNTWNVSGSARVTSDRCRFWGELTLPSSTWDKTGTDVTVSARASGMIRRLSQGASPVFSPMRRNFGQYEPHGYWPMEDESNSTTIASAVQSGTAATFTAVNVGVSADLPGTKSCAQFTGASSVMRGQANSAAATNVISWVFYVKLSSLPGSTKTFARFTANGLVSKVEVGVSTTSWVTTFYGSDGTVLDTNTTAISTISPDDAWIGYNLLLDVSGGNVQYSIRWDNIGVFGGGVGPTSLGAGSTGRAFSFAFFASSDSVFNDAQFAHMFISTTSIDLSNTQFRDASNAYLGEAAAIRMERLAAEEGVAIEIAGDGEGSEAMGYQTIDTLMNLLYECADTDRGVLGESRDALSLLYVTRGELEHRIDVTLDYDASELSDVPQPADDDQGRINDATASRKGGGSARYEVTEGDQFLTTDDPPAGIGRYDVSVSLSTSTDNRLQPIASWIAHVGAYDQERFPTVPVSMHRSQVTGKTDSVLAADIGGAVWLQNLPLWMPPDDVWLIVQGYSETLSRFMWDITYNTTAGGNYNTGRYDVDTEIGTARYDHHSSTLNSGINSSATSLSVALNSSTPTTTDKWTTDAGHFPFDVLVGGERMTVTNITGSTSPQTFTVTRSVNGVVKSHSAGARVRLFRPIFWRL